MGGKVPNSNIYRAQRSSYANVLCMCTATLLIIVRFGIAVRQYIRDSILFTPSQRWRSGVCNSPFPYCKLQHHQLASLRSSWNDLGTDRELVLSRYINYHAIETNALEGVVYFDDIVRVNLVI